MQWERRRVAAQAIDTRTLAAYLGHRQIANTARGHRQSAREGRWEARRSGGPMLSPDHAAAVGAALATVAAIQAALASGKGILKVAREFGTGSSVVQRIKAAGAPVAGH